MGVLKAVKGEDGEVVWEGRWENLVIGRRMVVEVGSLIVMKLVERKLSISDCGSAMRAGSST